MIPGARFPHPGVVWPHGGGLLPYFFSPVTFPYMHFPDPNQIPVGYTDTRSGEPVILLHCSGSSGRQWRHLKSAEGRRPDRLSHSDSRARAGAIRSTSPENDAAARFRWLTLDFYGYGESGFPSQSNVHRLEREAELVEHLLDMLAGPAHLVGHSFGGAVALLTAVRNPGRVRSLYAYEPVLFSLLRDCGRADQWEEVVALSAHFQGLLASGRPEQAVALFVDFWSGPGTFDAIPGKRRYELARAAGKIALDFEALYSVSVRLPEFASLSCPVLITSGTAGPQPAREVARLLGEAFGEESCQIVPGAGHMAPLTDPDRVNPLILAHLNRHRRG